MSRLKSERRLGDWWPPLLVLAIAVVLLFVGERAKDEGNAQAVLMALGASTLGGAIALLGTVKTEHMRAATEKSRDDQRRIEESATRQRESDLEVLDQIESNAADAYSIGYILWITSRANQEFDPNQFEIFIRALGEVTARQFRISEGDLRTAIANFSPAAGRFIERANKPDKQDSDLVAFQQAQTNLLHLCQQERKALFDRAAERETSQEQEKPNAS